MSGVNRVHLIGGLTRDPEVRHFENGNVVASMSLATSESYKNKSGEKVTDTEYHDLELWNGLAKIAEQYLSKGKTIYVEGKIKTDRWQNEQGENRSKVKIRVTSMTMLGGQGGRQDNNNQASHPATPQEAEPVKTFDKDGNEITDDLPF